MRLFGALAILGGCLAAGAFACGSSSNGSNSSPSSTDGGNDSSMVESGSGGPGDSGSDAMMEAAPAPYPAFVPKDVPQVSDQGGPVLKTPKLVPIFYAEDDPTTVASVKDFLSKLGATNWWKTWSTEYGVGSLTIADPIVLPDSLPPTWDDANIQADLQARLTTSDGGPGELPLPDGQTIYTYIFPPGVNITETGTPTDAGAPEGGLYDDGGVNCTVGGYHSDMIVGSGNTDVAYAVIPHCDIFGPITGLDVITGTMSHEIAEACTDPYPNGNPAYSQVDTPHAYWSVVGVGIGEVGDMCEVNYGVNGSFVKYSDFAYTVQRIWSNKAAKAGTDPCVPPVSGSVYYQSYPIMTDTVTISSRYFGTYMALGEEIPVGGSKTIELDLASTAPTSGPWSVEPFDQSATGNTYLNFAFEECGGASTCTGENGTKLHLKITVVKAGRRGNSEGFVIYSVFHADAGGPMAGEYNLWAGVAAQAPDGGTTPQDAGGGG